MANKSKPRHANRLTVKKIARLTTAGKYVDGGGLALMVSPIGSKSWTFRFERDGRDRAYVLGPIHGDGGATAIPRAERRGLTLDEARADAAKAVALLKSGIDPIDARDDARNATQAAKVLEAAEAAKLKTFQQAATEYSDGHASEWTNESYGKKFLNSLRDYAFPVIGALPVGAIDTPLVLRVIEPIWLTKNPTADKVRGRIEAVLAWATVRGLRTGDNPARWTRHLEEALPNKTKAKHHAALPYAEVPAFIPKLAEVRGEALEFLLLTAARSGEVIGAPWSEIDLKAKLWTVPGPRMKEKKEHRVPLVDRAVEILNGLPREDGNPFVFIGARKGQPLGKNTFYKLLESMGHDVTTHGFRSSFRTWAGDKTNFPADIAEAAISHASDDAYQRGDLFDKRRKLMEAWETYCLTGVSPTDELPDSENVIPIRKSVKRGG
jgi:integrase